MIRSPFQLGIGSRNRVNARSGFTLIEVLIVLSLSSLVMLMVGSAMRIHLRITDSRTTAVQNAQLSRIILRQISNDLRAVTFSESDEPPPDDDGDATGQQIDSSNQTIPGLYGDATQIRVDVVRAMETRSWFDTVDMEQQQIVDTDFAIKPYGSLQTVAYFIDGAAGLSGGDASTPVMDPQMLLQGSSTDSSMAGGLVRQVVDHPVASLSLSGGGGTDLNVYSQLFAREVVSMTFQYYDGTDWYSEWDSYEQGGLPLAVEVSIGLATPVDEDGDSSSFYQSFADADSTFTMLIHLPTALPTDETEAQL